MKRQCIFFFLRERNNLYVAAILLRSQFLELRNGKNIKTLRVIIDVYNFNWQRVKTLRVSNVKLERVRKAEIKIHKDIELNSIDQHHHLLPSSPFLSHKVSSHSVFTFVFFSNFHCIFPFYTLSQPAFRYTLIFNFDIFLYFFFKF